MSDWWRGRGLSPDMLDAMQFARLHGGCLVRFAGGYWSATDVPRTRGIPDEHFSASTVQALVRRGKMEYSQYRGVGGARYPIAATVKEGT